VEYQFTNPLKQSKGQKAVNFFVAGHVKQNGEMWNFLKKNTLTGKMEPMHIVVYLADKIPKKFVYYAKQKT